MSSPQLSVIILAAGKGTRMKSDKAKVLHEVFFTPMIRHVVNAVLPLNPKQIVTIVGHQQDAVQQVLQDFDLDFAVQDQQLGTGHAVLIAENIIRRDIDTVMILCGDTPLIKAETLGRMYREHRAGKAALTLMTTHLDDPTNYGRILTTLAGKIAGIVEQKDATAEQLRINEINAGIYCVDKEFLFSALKRVGTDNSQNEVYLTDIVKLAVERGLSVEKVSTDNPLEVLGVNSRVELAEAHKALLQRRNIDLMMQGVSMHQPESISVSPEVHIGRDTLLEPCVRITGSSRIGESCLIGQGAILENCRIGDHVVIGPYSLLSDTTVDAASVLAAFSRNP
ncbi:MAG: glycosyl transferase family 2 [Desulfobacterales bacterium GWB2_56_26]|nr:MAG: glycosyl transferase family 2 [Desulfobacterales bacterium GWB2_56_26]